MQNRIHGVDLGLGVAWGYRGATVFVPPRMSSSRSRAGRDGIAATAQVSFGGATAVITPARGHRCCSRHPWRARDWLADWYKWRRKGPGMEQDGSNGNQPLLADLDLFAPNGVELWVEPFGAPRDQPSCDLGRRGRAGLALGSPRVSSARGRAERVVRSRSRLRPVDADRSGRAVNARRHMAQRCEEAIMDYSHTP